MSKPINRSHILLLVSFLGVLLSCTLAAHAQRIVSALTSQEVKIDSTFSGETLTLFGNIEPAFGEANLGEAKKFDIVIVIQGPSVTHTLRKKERRLGLWLNSAGVEFENAPSYLQILSSGAISEAAASDILGQPGILFGEETIVNLDNHARDLDELLRLMSDAGVYAVGENTVSFLSPTLYRATLNLPANVPNGTFLAKTYLYADGEQIETRAMSFLVRTTGIERIIEDGAEDFPFLYGLICVVIAIFTGWLGSVAFRR